MVLSEMGIYTKDLLSMSTEFVNIYQDTENMLEKENQ